MQSENFTRKDVHLNEEVLKYLGIGAQAEHRPLKNYMEKVLSDKARKIKSITADKIGGKKK